jgi:uncharacterized protein
MADERTEADKKKLCDLVVEQAAQMMVVGFGAPIPMMVDRLLTYGAAQIASMHGSAHTAEVLRHLARNVEGGVLRPGHRRRPRPPGRTPLTGSAGGGIFGTGSIERFTGWSGKQADDATFGRTGHHTGREAELGPLAPRFAMSVGEPMSLQKFLHALHFARPVSLEVKARDGGHIEGLASPFDGRPDRQGDIIRPGAFARTLREHKAEGTVPAMLWSHAIDAPIGCWETLEERPDGLHVAGKINLSTERGREAYEHVRSGDVGRFSIGYLTPPGGRKDRGDGTFDLVEVDLVEVSVVTIPANPRAKIQGAKSIGSKAEAVEFLREAGLPKAAAVRFAAAGWRGLAGAPDLEAKASQLARRIADATAKLRRD